MSGSHAGQVSPRLSVDLIVESDHDQHRQPEGEAGGDDGVGVVDNEPTLVRIVILVLEVLRGGVPAQEDGEEGDAGGRDPGKDDHHDGGPHGDGGVVHQRLGYGVVPGE